MMTDILTRTGISWSEMNDLEYHTFKNIYQSISDSIKTFLEKE